MRAFLGFCMKMEAKQSKEVRIRVKRRAEKRRVGSHAPRQEFYWLTWLAGPRATACRCRTLSIRIDLKTVSTATNRYPIRFSYTVLANHCFKYLLPTAAIHYTGKQGREKRSTCVSAQRSPVAFNKNNNNSEQKYIVCKVRAFNVLLISEKFGVEILEHNIT